MHGSREWQPVKCADTRRRHRACNCYLGDVEVSRPNVSRHRCHLCNIVYEHEVMPGGHIECCIVKDKHVYTRVVAKVIRSDDAA